MVPHCGACGALISSCALASDASQGDVPPYHCGYCGTPYFGGLYSDLCERCADAEEGLAEQATLARSQKAPP